MARLNMLELGRRLGVDRSTISRALSEDKAHLVASATREKIRAEAALMGYSHDLMAATLRRGRSRTIGILTPDLLNEVLVSVIREIVGHLNRDVSTNAHIIPLIGETADRPDEFQRLLRTFLARRVDAVVSLASTERDVDVLVDVAKQVPVVLAVRSVATASFPSALCDDDAGGAMVAAHLAEQGHRVVCQIQGPQHAATFKNRSSGFARICKRAKLTESPRRIEAKSATSSQGKLALRAILESPKRATAVFAHNDALALGLIEAMRENGLRYPQDLAIVGFNDTEVSRVLAIPLTTVEYPVMEVSGHAARLVQNLISDASFKWETKIFPPKLIRRSST